jgi:hypothetical protein
LEPAAGLERSVALFGGLAGGLRHDGLARGLRHDVHISAAARRGFEIDDPLTKGEESMVHAHADIKAGVPLRPTLANDDIAADDALAAELLDAETTTLGVAPVAG